MNATRTLTVPLLENGDRLTIAEFMERYEAMPEVTKAELIEGVVYMASPVSTEWHGTPHAALMVWLGNYWFQTEGTQLSDNGTVKLRLGRNRPQPDALLRVLPSHGGMSKTDAKGYVVGTPELVAEVAASTASYDLHDKLAAYQKNGVREYVVWRVAEEAIDWFVLHGGKYRSLTPAKDDGLLKSRIFPGLWLDAAALLAGKLPRVMEASRLGVASEAHTAFAAKLRGRSS
jgi:Uma2 family endonuclease